MRETIYAWLQTVALRALLGDPPRATPAGEEEAPDSLADKQERQPYITWQIVVGSAENYLAESPDIDQYRIQWDVYGITDSQSWQVLNALRQALEPHGHEVSFNLDQRDSDTRLYRKSVDFEFWIERE